MKYYFNLFILILSLFFIPSCNRDKENNNNQESKKVVMLIYGHPACGKLTTAKEIAKKYNLNIVDNHFFNNLFFPYIKLNNENVENIYPEIHKVKKIWYDNIVKYGKNDKGFIFTDVLIDMPSMKQDVKNLMNFAKELNYQFIAIKLTCSEDMIKERIKSFERKKKFKLTDFEQWKKSIHSQKFLDVEKAYVINNENLNETLKIIDRDIIK